MELIKRKFKKFFLFLNLNQKRLIAVFLFFTVFGLLFPFYHAYAIFGIFGGVADAIGKAIGWIIAAFITAFAAAILAPSIFLLQWSIDPMFIRVPSYTSGAIVDIGWPIVRDIANMGIVLALIIIGLATALRLEEYQIRKTLPALIIIALLINFTKVILGLIVDFTNILMYFFLDGLMGPSFISSVFTTIHSLVVSDLSNFNFLNPLQLESFIIKIFIILLFYTLTSLILLLYAFLFILRRIAIWTLVIFSPLAFVSYILPATRRLWSMWWNQFIQWSIIGIFAAFFLYLGDHIIGLAATGAFIGKAPGGLGGWFTRPIVTILEQLMPYVVAMLFLLFGFFVALTTSAFGARQVIAGAQGFTKRLPIMAAESKVGKKVLGTGAERIAKGLEAAVKGTKELEQRASAISGIRGVAAKAAAKPLALATRATRAAAAPALLKYAARQRRVSIPKEFDEMSITEQQQYIESVPWVEDKITLAARMAEKGTFQKTSSVFQGRMMEEAKRLAENPYLKKEIGTIMDALPDKITAKMKIDFEVTPEAKQKMEEKINELAKETEISTEAAKLGIKAEDLAAAVIHVRGLKPGDIPNVSKSSLKSVAFRLGSQGFSSSHLQRLRESFDRETVEDVFTGEGGLNTIIKSEKDAQDFYLKNPRLVNWFMNSPTGIEWNWAGRRFMEPYGRFRQEMDIFARDPTLQKEPFRPGALLNFDRAYRRIEDIDRERQALIREGGPHPPAEIRRRIADMERTLREASEDYVVLEDQINANPELQELLEELRRVRGEERPPRITPPPGPPPPGGGGGGPTRGGGGPRRPPGD